MKEKKFDVLILFQISLLILGLLLGMYMKRKENYNLLPLQHILLSIMLFIMGLREYKRTQRLLWFILIAFISLFILFSTVNGMMIN